MIFTGLLELSLQKTNVNHLNPAVILTLAIVPPSFPVRFSWPTCLCVLTRKSSRPSFPHCVVRQPSVKCQSVDGCAIPYSVAHRVSCLGVQEHVGQKGINEKDWVQGPGKSCWGVWWTKSSNVAATEPLERCSHPHLWQCRLHNV